MILLIDNYDSFAYNLVQYIGEFDEVAIKRNDAIDIDGIRELNPDGIVVSPGPGTPAEAGVSIDVFSKTTYPALGVCLGHQALCAAHGAPVEHAPDVVHGKPSRVNHDETPLYTGVDNPFEVGRYHSLAVKDDNLPDELEETAYTTDVSLNGGASDVFAVDEEDSVVMGVQHVDRPQVGVQFHPESILTEAGERIIENFCKYIADV